MKQPDIADQWIQDALAEDIGQGDKTTLATIDPSVQAKGTFLAKQELTLCGQDIAKRVFELLDTSAKVEFSHEDGDQIAQGEVFGTVIGPAHILLQGERTALNLLQRLSGISTLTHEYAKIVFDSNTTILDTRKTLPHYRALEKYAVVCGGGTNHRMRLDDQMMIKDNHITANGGDVATTVQKAKAKFPDTYLVVEIAHPEQIGPAIEQGADRLLLDNMDNSLIQKCQEIIQKRVPIEISGGVTKERLPSLAKLGVDFVSIGALTHSAISADISMKIEL